ncbi:MAG TPA: M13 family metallopeptidase [Kofleriaceae bacterium]|nr:M13 family metallopeptidase [Kofleriaceae bacterium]
MNLRVLSLVSLVSLGAACGSHAAQPPASPQPGLEAAAPPAPAPSTPAPAPRVSARPGQHGVYTEDLDRAVEPCTDFYEFSNGSWRKQNPIPAEMPRWSRRWQAGETSKDRLKEILEEVSARNDWPAASVEQLIGDFYAGCMDQAQSDQRGITPLGPLLAEIDHLRTVADVGRMVARLHAISVDVLFAFGGNSDLHTPTDVIAWVGSSGLGLPDRDYYLKTEPRFTEARTRYLAHVAEMLRLAGAAPAAAKRDAATVMKLELGLAKASLDNVALRDPTATDHAVTPAELQKLTPSFDWAAYFKAAGVAPARLNVTEPAFLAEVERQLKAAPVADWKVYFRWHLIHSAAASLAQPLIDEDFAFNGKYLGGTEDNKPRWKRCVEATDSLLGEALGKKYTDKYFPPAAKARMQLLVKNLLAAMHDTIVQLDWMSDATKQRALEKLATFNPKVGYPDKWKDYSTIPVRRDRFWETTAAARTWNVKDNLATIGKPLDRGRWGLTPPTSDAYYNPPLNEIVFPAGILQPPAFSMDAVDAVNYGAIGVVIGHEISHGFDDMGAQFDAQGRLSNWWTKDDLAKFQARGRCVVDQFESYFIEPNIHHQGKLVLGESIGDLGGVNLAYRAFQKAQQQAPAPVIDGFTPLQQFFIAWGQFRGDAVRPETQRLMVQGDPHPIGKFRVIGPLSNMPEFRAAFACKADAAMVRPDAVRCAVW